MDAKEFETMAIGVLRSGIGWQSAIARRLGVNSRTVRKWLQADVVPGWAEDKLMEWMGGRREVAEWPRDEWVIGDIVGRDGRRREYIVRVQPPRFVARIVVLDGDGQPAAEELPADVIGGITYSIDDETLLCEVFWIDAIQPGRDAALLEAAAGQVRRMES